MAFVLLNIGHILAQEPLWLKPIYRESTYPNNEFITSLIQDNKEDSETTANAIERVKNLASANLVQSIISNIESINSYYAKSNIANGNENFNETYTSEVKATTNIEINGLKVETFISGNIVSAFAYANKSEITGYYMATLNMTLEKIRSTIESAAELENQSEKNKAKNLYKSTLPLFSQIQNSQGILAAINKDIQPTDLKMDVAMSYLQQLTLALSRLEQSILVFIETDEDLFGSKQHDIENQLKAELAKNNCSFSNEKENADWRISIKAKAREQNFSNGFYFSYVDATVWLYKSSNNKNIYQNSFSQKGVHNISYTTAAQEAYKKSGQPIATELIEWINK